MIFRNPDYSKTEPNKEIESIIKQVFYFVIKLIPATQAKQIKETEKKLSVIICNDTLIHKHVHNGVLQDTKLIASAHKFWTDIDTNNMSANQGIALRPNCKNKHTIAHETLHAFSSSMGKTPNGGYVKVGSLYTITDDTMHKTVESHGSVLNEAITDALASRFQGTIGPGTGAGYGPLVLLADLLIGEELENNLFLQDVYWGMGNKFEKDFDKTVKTSQIKFANYLKPFVICGTPEDNLNSDNLLQGAIEYKLRKAQTLQEIDKTYAFQQEIINFYKNGGWVTGFIEDTDIERMDNLLKFAKKIRLHQKLKITNKNQANKKQTTHLSGSKTAQMR